MGLEMSLDMLAAEAIEAFETNHDAIRVIRLSEAPDTLIFEYFPSLE